MKSFPIIFAVSALFFFGSTQATIKAAAIVFRHGQRTPAGTPTVPMLESSTAKEIGLGQLTNYGSWQCYNNGMYLRSRYQHLFPESGFFRLKNMRLRTSVPERTIMSLQSFMAGFFPPPVTAETLPIHWQPFFHDIDYEAKFVYYESSKCPKFQATYEQMLATPSEKEKRLFEEEKVNLAKYEALFGTSMKTGMEVFYVADTVLMKILMAEEDLPYWAIEAYYTTLYKFMPIIYESFFGNEFMVKVRGGGLMTELLENMEKVINGDEDAKNLLIYSGHELNVRVMAEMLDTVDQLPNAMPSLADTIIVELVDNGESEMQVQFLYVDNERVIPTRSAIDVPGCGKICNFSTFKSLMSKYVITDWEALCAL